MLKTYNNIKLRFSLITEQIMAFTSRLNMVREVKNLSPNFKQIVWLFFTFLNILIWIVRSVLSITLNSSTTNYTQIACI